jgi:Fur family zinc uptake transcriptional regulator
MLSQSCATNQHNLTVDHDHTDCLANALANAKRLCSERKVQLTPIRHQVLTLIWQSHQAVKAYDLLDQIKPLQPSAKPATIYRALDFLLEHGLIHRIESLNAFIGCGIPVHGHEQLILICKVCHEVIERPGVEVMQAINNDVNLIGFIAHSKALEIHGVCAKCIAKEDGSTKDA